MIKNYNVTDHATGTTTRHAGLSPSQITSGEISAETIARGYHTLAMDWNPDPAVWNVEEVPAQNGLKVAYPIWNKTSHGPAVPLSAIADEEQQPPIWVVGYPDQLDALVANQLVVTV